MADIGASVGRNGVNRIEDVKVVQTLINRAISDLKLTPFLPLVVSGYCDSQTMMMIEEFQRRLMRLPKPDGRVDPSGRTIRALEGSKAGPTLPVMDPVLEGNALPGPAAKVLKEILASAAIPKATVTSVSRTPADQARVMYDNCMSKGVAFNKNMYAGAGDKVVDIYAANKDKPRDVVIGLMLAKINEVGPSKVSKHISDTHYTFDVAPSSIAPSKHAKFLEAIKAHKAVSNVIPPPTDPAFHIEIPKNSPHLK